MALISLRQLLDHAAEHSYGVPAFNVNNLEQTRAIMEAADQTDSPVIMQASAGAREICGRPISSCADGGGDDRVPARSSGCSSGSWHLTRRFASAQSSWASAQS